MSTSVSPQHSDTSAPRSTGATRALPGLAVGAGVSAAALGLNLWVPTLSPLLVAIVVGATLANTGRLSPRLEPGLAVASRRLLRLGVALLGLQLALGDVLRLGWGVIGVVVAVVVLGIAGGVVVGRLLGLSRSQTLLIAGGFSICGAAAAAAVDGVIESDDEELVTSVALVVLFGTAMIPLLPLLAGWIGLAPAQAGMWAGASIHEVAQVVAASSVIGSGALAVGVVVKLGRVLLLAPVLAVISLRERRLRSVARAGADGAADSASDSAADHSQPRAAAPALHSCRSSSWVSSRSWRCGPRGSCRRACSRWPSGARPPCSPSRCSPSARACGRTPCGGWGLAPSCSQP